MRCRRVVFAVSAISCGGAALLAVSSAMAETGPGQVQQQRILHTIPEDGQAADVVAPDELVRALMASRPREDLVICLGGCASDRDRVVYAQPSRPAPEPPVAAAPAAPGEPQGSLVPTAVPPTDEPVATPEPAHVQEATPPAGSMTSTTPDAASLPSLPEAPRAAE